MIYHSIDGLGKEVLGGTGIEQVLAERNQGGAHKIRGEAISIEFNGKFIPDPLAEGVKTGAPALCSCWMSIRSRAKAASRLDAPDQMRQGCLSTAAATTGAHHSKRTEA